MGIPILAGLVQTDWQWFNRVLLSRLAGIVSDQFTSLETQNTPKLGGNSRTNAKITDSLVVLLVSAVAAVAQNPYQVDNFDFANGVRVQRPPVEPTKKSQSAEVRKLTSSQKLQIYPCCRVRSFS